MTDNKRTAEYLNESGQWTDIRFECIRKNNKFRLFEDKEKTEPVEGGRSFTALADVYVHPEYGQNCIKVDFDEVE